MMELDEILELVLAAQQEENLEEVERIFRNLPLEQQKEFPGFYDTALIYDARDNEAEDELAMIVAHFTIMYKEAALQNIGFFVGGLTEEAIAHYYEKLIVK